MSDSPGLSLLLGALGMVGGFAVHAADYAGFASFPTEKKLKIVWDLHDHNAWGKPEQKPICRDLLENQSYRCSNSIAYTSSAIDLAEKEGWTDLKPLIVMIYKTPHDYWVLERAFRYLRGAEGKPDPVEVIHCSNILEAAGVHRSKVTDEQLTVAARQLAQNSDREAVLVYTLKVAGWPAGKGGSERGRLAAVEVLRSLPREEVLNRLVQLYRDSSDLVRREVLWVADEMKIDVGARAPGRGRSQLPTL